MLENYLSRVLMNAAGAELRQVEVRFRWEDVPLNKGVMFATRTVFLHKAC